MHAALELTFPAFNDYERRDGRFGHSQSTPCEIIGVDDLGANGGNIKLAVLGTYTGEFAGDGQWYWLEGCEDIDYAAQAGQWSAAATLGSSFTVFQLENWARVDDRQVGWVLQPDINAQVFLPITSVDENSHTVTVAGSYAALGVAGKRFRIHAPPGVEAYGENAGLLSKWTSASFSRCLYAGYRFESPLAGHREPATSTTAGSIINRQSGKNYAGLHYTLHRHYDPSLMRFTSADPIASRANLFAYCDNNPHGSYDPDGLEGIDMFGLHLSTDKYGSRMWSTVEGMGFGVADVFTLGQYFDDSDRDAMVWKHAQQGNGHAFAGGYLTGSTLFVATATAATGGYAASATPGILAAMASTGGTTALTGASLGTGGMLVGGMVGGAVGGGMAGGWLAVAGGGGVKDVVAGVGSGIVLGGAGEMLAGAATTLAFAGAGRAMGALAGPIGRLAGRIAPFAPRSRYFSPLRAGQRGSVLNPFGKLPKPSTIGPGPNAGASLPARGVTRAFTKAERAVIDLIGFRRGCHTCGASGPGTISTHWIPDHQPPSALVGNAAQRLYPHCRNCSIRQGGDVNGILSKKRIKP